MITKDGEIIIYLMKDSPSIVLNQVFNFGEDGYINEIVEIETQIDGGY